MKLYPSALGDIYLGSLPDGLAKVIHSLKPSTVLFIADDNTAKHCIPELTAITDTDRCVIIAAGEEHKTMENCQQIWSFLIEMGADRSTLVLNLGGGMICDLGGFVASCYQRGIRFGNIPTSVLSMADAAVGGKTAVNFGGYKNYIGRFEAPSFIWIDPVFIKSLPPLEITNGLAEIIKHAIIKSRSLWDMLYGIDDVATIDWKALLEENLPIKKQIVEADPLEKGIRKVLNFGHTIGHALESHFLPSAHPLSHGECITLGMLAESRLAHRAGILGEKDFQRIIELIDRLLSPVEVTLPSAEEIQLWIKGDKKKSGGLVGFSLPDRIGSCSWDIVVEDQVVADSIDWLSGHVKRLSVRLSE